MKTDKSAGQPEAVRTPDVPERPARMRLRRPHGFVDAGGAHRYWRAGQVVADAAEIATLVERGAPVEPVEG